MQLCVETNGQILEISKLCSEISWKDELNNGARPFLNSPTCMTMN
ncbi:MAG: hypothetical protein ACLR8P_01470 [Clostridium fessum]